MSNDLSDPQKFVMADVVTKNSKTGITSNKRLLVIKKGHLYYYSTVPKNYKNDIKFLQSYHELPKCSIQILNIKKINGFETGSNYFSIEFEARHMMEREDIRKTMTLEEFNFAPKNKKETITWQFTCDNQMVKQKWVHTLETLHTHYGKEKVNIQKFFDNINRKEEEKEQMPQMAIRSSLKVPWREDQIKKSGSNESPKLQLRSSQMSNNRSPSPSNGKKSSNEPKKNQIKLHSPDSQEDIVESFMKIEKTKSMHEPLSPPITEENQEVYQSTKKEQHGDDKLEKQEEGEKRKEGEEVKEEEEKFENLFGRKQTIIFNATQEPDSPIKDYKVSQNQPQPPKQQPKPTNSQKALPTPTPIPISFSPQQKPPSPSPPKLSQRISLSRRPQPALTKLPSLQERPSNLSKSLSIHYSVDSNTNFYELVFFGANREYSFERRIDAQRKVNSVIGGFTDKAVRAYVEFVNAKGLGEGKAGRFAQEKISQGLSMLEIGYSKFKIGYVNTQSVSINGKQKIFYNESIVKSLKRQMQVYNKLFSLINTHLRNLNKPNPLNTQASLSLSLSLSRSQAYSEGESKPINSETELGHFVDPSHLNVSLRQLRVPLCTYVEYKGICAMVYDDSLKSKEVELEKDQLNQWKELIRCLGFNSNCFEFRAMETTVGQVIIAYITTAGSEIYLTQKPQKHHNVTFESPINIQFLKRAKKQGASTSTESLSRYIKSIQQIKDTHTFTCPRPEILTSLAYCYLCKYLRKFYRAAHGEIDQLNFVNLLLKGDSKMNRLFESSGFQFLFLGKEGSGEGMGEGGGVLGIFFQFLLYYLGIYCTVDVEKCGKFSRLVQVGVQGKDEWRSKDDNCVKEVKTVPRVIGYCLDGLEFYETFAKTDHYIAIKSKQLAYKALQYKESAYFQNPFQLSSYPWQASSECLLASAQLNYIENDYITSIQKCKEFLHTVLPHSSSSESEQKWSLPTPSCCIPIYFLMIKCYSKFSKEKFSQTVKEAMEGVMYSFGERSAMMVLVFSFVALAFYGIGDYGQAENYLRVGLGLAEDVYRGFSRAKISELYLDYSRLLLQQNKIAESNQYLKLAGAIIQSTGTPKQKLNLLLYTLQTILKMPKSLQHQQKSQQSLYKAQTLLTQQPSLHRLQTLNQLHSLQYKLSQKYPSPELATQAIQSLWSLDSSSSKLLAIQYAYRMVGARFEDINERYEQILGKGTLSREKSLLLVQERVGEFRGLGEMMLEVFQEMQEEELVCAILRLIPVEVFRSF